MIQVRRVKGGSLYLNCDLIESIEATPDTVITLANGHRLLTADAPESLVRRIREFRAAILASAEDQRRPRADLIVLSPSEA